MSDKWVDTESLRRELEEVQARVQELERAKTEQSKNDEMLRESERRYRLLAENATDMIARYTPAGVCLAVSPAIGPLLGYHPDEVVGKSAFEFIHPVDLASVRTCHMKIVRQPVTEMVEFRLRQKSGSYVWVESTGRMVRDPQSGRPQEIITVTRNISKRKRAEDALRAIVEGTARGSGEQFFRNLVRHFAAALGVRYAMAAEVPADNPRQARVLAIWTGEGFGDNIVYDLEGTPCENILSQRVRLFPQDVSVLFPKDAMLVNMGVESYLGSPLRDSTGKVVGLLSVMDVRPMEQQELADSLLTIFSSRAANELERLRAERALRDYEQRLDIAVTGSNAGLWDVRFHPGDTLDTVEDIYISPKLKSFLGYRDSEFPNSVSAWRSRIPREDYEKVKAAARAHIEGKTDFYEVDYRIMHRDGSLRWLRSGGRIVRDSQGNPVRWAGMDWDITQLKTLEQQLRFDALHDTLTKLPNRTLFLDRLEHSLKVLERNPGYQFAVLFLDLDDFKYINDSFGHTAGDLLLLEVVQRLQACVRPGDTVARLGGDEFVVLLDFILRSSETKDIARRILDALKHPFEVAGHEISVSASIGIASSNQALAETASEFLRDADTAMYRAKSWGKNRYAVFDSSMHEAVMHRVTLEEEFRRALRKDEFVLFYQPIVRISDEQLAGFEALARWVHPTRGLLGPTVFIPLAEQANLIVALGKWVIEQACRQARLWQERFHMPLRMHINLSAKQLMENTLEELLRTMLELSLSPMSGLHLEITESTLMEHGRGTLSMLQRLRDAGIKLTIDDFGTGYSSLNYLRRLPIDSLKIDRSFVSQIDSSSETMEVVRAIRALGQAFHLDLVAEGVETRRQLELIQEVGCEYAQGYLFSPPLEASQAEQMLQTAQAA